MNAMAMTSTMPLTIEIRERRASLLAPVIAAKEKPMMGDINGATIIAQIMAGALLLSNPKEAMAVAMPSMK